MPVSRVSAEETARIPRTAPDRSLIGRALAAHDRLAAALAALAGWAPGLLARLVFAAVLLPYYLSSAMTKPGEGLLGVLQPAAGAFAQMLPPIAEAAGYDSAKIAVIPWHLIVIFGTLAEFALPALIVAGLWTRLAALGMIGFVAVQTYVDVAFHGAKLGGLFDRAADGLADTRLLWLLPLILLALQGPGRLSLDAALGGLLRRR